MGMKVNEVLWKYGDLTMLVWGVWHADACTSCCLFDCGPDMADVFAQVSSKAQRLRMLKR